MKYKYSGHGTFPCRYTWLPKAVRALKSKPNLFSNVDEAMVELGVGKQMVRAIRFWVEAAKIAEKDEKNNLKVTPLGEKLMGANGFDSFMEDSQTLWLIHWNFSTHRKNPIFAWDFLMNRWQEPEISPSHVVDVFVKEAQSTGKKLSKVTLKEHFDVFLHTYLPTRGIKGDILEDNLDSPLIELDLIRQVGERALDGQNGKRESVYTFNRDHKPQLSQALFVYCLNDFWNNHNDREGTLSFREVASGYTSPGQVFKLPEQEIVNRLDNIENDTGGAIRFHESVNVSQLIREKTLNAENLLNSIYSEGI
ncbi:MAG: DUF4007 family protein [Candidatus Poribacteria bacterium]|nr:DUF4007 family protein [Candidatus Poribacteria bacterium]